MDSRQKGKRINASHLLRVVERALRERPGVKGKECIAADHIVALRLWIEGDRSLEVTWDAKQ